MKKIPSIFMRDFEGNPSLVTQNPEPQCDWVFKGEGVPTHKRDGTSCMVRRGALLKRYDAKGGKPAPVGFEPCQDPDPNTGHWPGWVPVGPDDKWHVWTFYVIHEGALDDGTYELCGPKLQGNPERFSDHKMILHGSERLPDMPRDFEGIKGYLKMVQIEGLVFHHPDGRMAKIKRTDFGFDWPVKGS